MMPHICQTTIPDANPATNVLPAILSLDFLFNPNRSTIVMMDILAIIMTLSNLIDHKLEYVLEVSPQY